MADNYKIGVAIMLSDGMSPVLSALSHRLLGIHKSVKEIESGFGRWKIALGGAAAIMAGAGVFHGLARIAEHGEKLLDQQDKLIRAGRTHAEVAELTARAYDKVTKAVPTATAADVLRVANELTLVKGNFADAADAAAMSLKLEAVMGNSTGRKAEGEGYNVWRALELKNVTLDHARTDKLMGGMMQAMMASGGKITGLDWLTTARQGGVAWTNLNDDFMTGGLPSVIQELGGQRTGTSLMTAYQTMLGATTLKKQQVEMFNKLGMLDMTKVQKDHGHWNLDPGAIKGSGIGMSNPYKWTQEILKPALVAAGYETIEKQREVMAKIFPNRNANRMFDIFLDPNSVARIEKDRGLYSQAMPLNESYDSYTKNNPKGVKEGFHAQYESMMQAMGAPMMQAALPVMKALTDLFNNIGGLAAANPGAVKIIGEGIAALGIALTAGGVAAIAVALGPAGWIVGGIVALGAAVAAFAPDVLAAIGSHLSVLGQAASAAVAPLKWLADAVSGLAHLGFPLGGGGKAGGGGGGVAPGGASGEHTYNAIPPSGGKTKMGSAGDIYLDGRKVGEIVSKHQATAMNGPLNGSAYYDGNATFVPADYAFARG